MIKIPRKVHAFEHPDMYSSEEFIDGKEQEAPAKYSRGGEFLENYMSGNPLEFGRRWFHLGDIYDVIYDIGEFFDYNMYTDKGIDWNRYEAMYEKSDKLIPAFNELPYGGIPAMVPLDGIPNDVKEGLIKKIKEDNLI